MATATATNKDADTLNHLLRGEISAIETYENALTKFSDPEHRTIANALTRIRDEHAASVGSLRSRVVQLGGTPSDGAGVWGAFANAVAGVAKMIGMQTAVGALKQGELHGISDYEKALGEPDVSVEAKFLIRNDLLPRCREHVSQLEGIEGQLDTK